MTQPQPDTLETSFARVVTVARRLGRLEGLQSLVDGIRAGGDAVELIHAMLEFEKLAMAADDERRARQ